MFQHFNDDALHNIHLLLSWWAVLGFFSAGIWPSCKGNKKMALKQCFLLGPFFWIGVPLVGLFYGVRGFYRGINNG